MSRPQFDWSLKKEFVGSARDNAQADDRLTGIMYRESSYVTGLLDVSYWFNKWRIWRKRWWYHNLEDDVTLCSVWGNGHWWDIPDCNNMHVHMLAGFFAFMRFLHILRSGPCDGWLNWFFLKIFSDQTHWNCSPLLIFLLLTLSRSGLN